MSQKDHQSFRIPLRMKYSAFVSTALDKALNISAAEEFAAVRSLRVQPEQVSLYDIAYLNRVRAHLHDCILSKFSNALFQVYQKSTCYHQTLASPPTRDLTSTVVLTRT